MTHIIAVQRNVLTTGGSFRGKMCYDDIPNVLNPYDYDAFNAYQDRAYAVATNIETGQAEYLRLKDMHKDIIAVRGLRVPSAGIEKCENRG